MVYQLIGGLKAGMGCCGCRTITEMQERARFLRVTVAGLREGHVHDVIIPNGLAENTLIISTTDHGISFPRWMKSTDDPLLRGPVKAPHGAQMNDPDGISPNEPTQRIS